MGHGALKAFLKGYNPSWWVESWVGGRSQVKRSRRISR